MVSPPKDQWVLKVSYRYANETGEIVFEKQRLERGEGADREKRFRVRHYVKGQGWAWTAPATIYPYHVDEVIKAGPDGLVWVVEGEKCADAIRAAGGIATSGVYGANPGTFLAEWAKYFKDRRVVLLPDMDDNGKGQTFMRGVYELLQPVANSCTYLELQGLPNKGDVFDWFALGHDYEELKELAFSAMQDPAPPPAPGHSSVTAGAAVAAAPGVTDDGEGMPEWKPMPLDALPDVLAEFCHAGSEVMQCDPAYFALPALVACSGAIGTKRMLRLNPEWPEPAILWAVLIADSGTMKSPACDLALAPVTVMQEKMFAQYCESKERYDDQVLEWEATRGRKGDDIDPAFRSKPSAPIAKRIKVGDITIEKLCDILADNPKGVMLLRDEVAGWFGSFLKYRDGKGASDVPFWLEAFNGRSWTRDRKGGDRTTIFIRRCCVPVFGNTQPHTARGFFTPELLTSGFIARILMCQPPKRKKVFAKTGIPGLIKERYAAAITRLFEAEVSIDAAGNLTPLDVFPSEDGMAAWEQFMLHWSDIQWAADGELAAALAKLEAYCARLSLIFACVDHADGKLDQLFVERRHVESAFRMVEWFAHEAERLYCAASDEHHGDVSNLTLKYLQRIMTPVTPRELLQSCPSRYRKVSRAKAVLDELVRAQKGKWVPRPAGPSGGRPTEEFHLL